MGIGETMADLIADPAQVLHARDLLRPAVVPERLRFLQRLKQQQMAALGIPASSAADQELSLLHDPLAPQEFAGLFAPVARRVRFAPSAEAALSTYGAVVLTVAGEQFVRKRTISR